MNLLDHTAYAYKSAELVAANGVTAHIGTDFNEMKAVHRDVRPNDLLTPIFDPDHSDIGPYDGLWMKGVTDEGEVVQLQMMRYFNLGQQTLADHLKERATDYIPPSVGKKVDLTTTLFDTAPITAQLTGRVVYHGGFWLAKSKRGGGFTGLFPRFLMNFAAQAWTPDCFFCFQSRELMFGGLGAKEGYTSSDDKGILWGLQDGGHLEKGILWVERENFPRMLNYEPSDTFRVLEGMRRAVTTASTENK